MATPADFDPKRLTRRSSLWIMASGVTGAAAGSAVTAQVTDRGEPSDAGPSPCLPAAAGNFMSLDRFAVAGEPLGAGNVAHDSAAFGRAFTAMMAELRSAPIEGNRAYTFTSLFVPPGDYKVAGGFGAKLAVCGIWAVPGSVTITITEDRYFLEIPNRLDYTYISGLRFIGGKGALRHAFTGTNVSNTHIVERNIFDDYTECAISSDSENMPYWRLRENSFYCHPRAAHRTKGVALGGLLDNAVIDDNNFLRNRIHLQLGPIRSGSVQIRNNDFLSFTPDFTDVDLWLIPEDRPANFGTNTGQGYRIVGNKFGNELLSDRRKKAPRMLVAAATANARLPTDRALFSPDPGWKTGDDGANWLRGLIIAENYITTSYLGGTDGPDASFMDIHIEKMDLITWRDNVIDGGRYEYLFRFMDNGARRAIKDNTSWNVTLQADRAGRSPVRQGVSNGVIGLVNDANGFVQGIEAALPAGMIDPAAREIAALPTAAAWRHEARVTASGTAQTGSATVMRFPDPRSGLVLIVENAARFAGTWVWLDLQVEAAATDAAAGFQVIATVATRRHGVTTQLDQIMPVPKSSGQSTLINWYVPVGATVMTLYLRAPYAAPGADRLEIGAARLSSGRTPAPR